MSLRPGAEPLWLQAEPAVWEEGFTEQGKWMDGWETRRKRIPGHDWCIIQLGLPGNIFGVEVDTSYFTGNFAPRASLQAARLNTDLSSVVRLAGRGQAASPEQIREIGRLESERWENLVSRSALGPGYRDSARSFFTVGSARGRGPFTHLPAHIYFRNYFTCTGPLCNYIIL